MVNIGMKQLYISYYCLNPNDKSLKGDTLDRMDGENKSTIPRLRGL